MEEDSPEAYLQAAEQWVEAMFTGDDRVALVLRSVAKGRASGRQRCEGVPGKTAVALYRNHVFAQIKPTTNTRIDFGLALGT